MHYQHFYKRSRSTASRPFQSKLSISMSRDPRKVIARFSKQKNDENLCHKFFLSNVLSMVQVFHFTNHPLRNNAFRQKPYETTEKVELFNSNCFFPFFSKTTFFFSKTSYFKTVRKFSNVMKLKRQVLGIFLKTWVATCLWIVLKNLRIIARITTFTSYDQVRNRGQLFLKQ